MESALDFTLQNIIQIFIKLSIMYMIVAMT